jgi:chaperonin GroEL
MHIERKILSPYFITNESKMVADFDNPYIFLIDSKVFKLKTILPALQKASENDKPILIIVREIEGEALSGLVVNAMKGNLKVAAIKAPGFGDIRKEYFKDIAVYTGGEIISDDYGININDFDPELHLGSAKKVICGEDTVIREGNKNNKKFEERLNYLKEKIKNNDVSFYEKERISKRIGNLSSSVTIIKVGANTEVELNEKKLRIEDSLNATKSAIEKGIVLGGGLTLLKISQKLKKIKSDDEYENKTLKILINALSAPIKQIIKNAGDNPDIIIHKIIESNMELGYNANKNKLSNLMDDGVIDPAKVIINIINNSISVAGLILTTEVILSERKNTNIYGSYLEDE